MYERKKLFRLTGKTEKQTKKKKRDVAAYYATKGKRVVYGSIPKVRDEQKERSRSKKTLGGGEKKKTLY